MKAWVLVIMLLNNDGSSMTTVYFDTMQACINTRKAYSDQYRIISNQSDLKTKRNSLIMMPCRQTTDLPEDI